MRILIFTEGTTIMHKNAAGYPREDIVKQVEEKEPSVKKYSEYVPVGNAAEKLETWKNQGAEIVYLTSRTKSKEIEEIKEVLNKYGFPKGELFYRKTGITGEDYAKIVEGIMPDILIEDDCESVGSEYITYPHIEEERKRKIKSILVKEFGGIDHLPEKVNEL